MQGSIGVAEQLENSEAQKEGFHVQTPSNGALSTGTTRKCIHDYLERDIYRRSNLVFNNLSKVSLFSGVVWARMEINKFLLKGCNPVLQKILRKWVRMNLVPQYHASILEL